jgi:choline-glycine betaine transporter
MEKSQEEKVEILWGIHKYAAFALTGFAIYWFILRKR